MNEINKESSTGANIKPTGGINVDNGASNSQRPKKMAKHKAHRNSLLIPSIV